MASKRAIRRKSCDGKIQYADQGTAWKVSHRLMAAKPSGTSGATPYKCQFCARWHVGHRPQRVMKAIRARLDE